MSKLTNYQYYWVSFKNNPDEFLIARYNISELWSDTGYPWSIFGSNEIYAEDTFIVISEINIIK